MLDAIKFKTINRLHFSNFTGDGRNKIKTIEKINKNIFGKFVFNLAFKTHLLINKILIMVL